MTWIDTHCHLDLLPPPLESILKTAAESRVAKIISIGTDTKSNAQILNMINQHSMVYGALGVHPHNAKQWQKTTGDLILKQAEHPKIVAIGECGADFHYQFATVKQQQTACTEQLEIAVALGLPVVVHSRTADAKTIEWLTPFAKKGLRGVLHSFTGSLKLKDFALDFGFYLSLNGILTFAKESTLQNLAKELPLDKILIETDAPYLSPVPFRGQTNQPSRVYAVGEFLASILGLTPEVLARQLRQNTYKLFPKLQ